MTRQKIYGDEDTGYLVLARDMSPVAAERVLETNKNDDIYMQMPHDRKMALEIKAGEKQ